MTKDEALGKVRYHWYSYVARGGFNEPRLHAGALESGGLVHWTAFLKAARQYLSSYPKDRYLVEGFVPEKTVKFLLGE